MIQAIDHESNFKPRPQRRKKGSGAGKVCRPWVSWGWLLIAAERIVVRRAGSETALLKERYWAKVWGIRPDWLRRQLEGYFPGISKWLESTPGGSRPWYDLKNRVYKMYYRGTSDRGPDHDPRVRAAVSSEHWRSKDYRLKWEKQVLEVIQSGLPYKDWRDWL